MKCKMNTELRNKVISRLVTGYCIDSFDGMEEVALRGREILGDFKGYNNYTDEELVLALMDYVPES